jgi:hypothetical protein
MGRAKTWSSHEAELAARAYIAATHDSINGSGQKAEDFAKRVHEEFSKLTPAGVGGTGTYSDRDPDCSQQTVWKYVRDTILKETQKFNATLNVVLNSGLTGVTHDEKVNIAVAMHLNRIKDGNNKYDYRPFESESKWRLFKAWYILKDTEKVALPREVRHPADELSTQEDQDMSTDVGGDNEGFITDSSGSDKKTGLNSTTRSKKRTTYQGRDAAKREEHRAYLMERRTSALDDIAATEKTKLKVIEDLKTQVQAQNMIAMLSHPSIQGNETLSNRMMKRIMDVMGMNEPTESTNNAPQNEEVVTMLTAEEIANVLWTSTQRMEQESFRSNT